MRCGLEFIDLPSQVHKFKRKKYMEKKFEMISYENLPERSELDLSNVTDYDRWIVENFLQLFRHDKEDFQDHMMHILYMFVQVRQTYKN